MKQGSFVPRGTLIVVVWCLAPGLALAYIDPGNGAYMVQALFTLVGAALFYLRHPIRTLRSLLDHAGLRWRKFRGPSLSDAPCEVSEVAAETEADIAGLCVQKSPEQH